MQPASLGTKAEDLRRPSSDGELLNRALLAEMSPRIRDKLSAEERSKGSGQGQGVPPNGIVGQISRGQIEKLRKHGSGDAFFVDVIIDWASG